MPKIIISDTSTLIIFQKIEALEILQKVYGELLTTPQIALEFGDDLPSWIKIESVTDTKYLRFLSTQIDIGEASALALAAQFEDVLLLLDDLKARKLAAQLDFKFTGTLGILYKAKQLSIISKVNPYIENILKTDFRISKQILQEFLKINNELL